MKLHADQPGTSHYIQRFEPGAVLVSGQWYRSPIIVSADRVVSDWRPSPLATLSRADFAAALELEPEVILFGTGLNHHFPGARLAFEIMSGGVGFEVMNTAAACRTYNVLMAEDRRVVAALLLD